MMRTEGVELLADFEAGRSDPARFRHGEHVQVSYELLERHPSPRRFCIWRGACAGSRGREDGPSFITRRSRRPFSL